MPKQMKSREGNSDEGSMGVLSNVRVIIEALIIYVISIYIVLHSFIVDQP